MTPIDLSLMCFMDVYYVTFERTLKFTVFLTFSVIIVVIDASPVEQGQVSISHLAGSHLIVEGANHDDSIPPRPHSCLQEVSDNPLPQDNVHLGDPPVALLVVSLDVINGSRLMPILLDDGQLLNPLILNEVLHCQADLIPIPCLDVRGD